MPPRGQHSNPSQGLSTKHLVRPSGLEAPRGKLPTRPSTSFARAICVRPRPDRPFCTVADASDGSDEMTCVRDVSRRSAGSGGKACRLTEATGAVASLPARADRSHVSSLDPSRARQGAAAWLRAPRCRVGAARRPPRAQAQQGPGALAPQLRAFCDRVRVSGWRGSARCADSDRVATALACVHEDRRALRR
jgi:hypothetical protein